MFRKFNFTWKKKSVCKYRCFNCANINWQLLWNILRNKAILEQAIKPSSPGSKYDGTQPQINTRDTRLPIPPRVMVSSAMGLNLEVFGYLPTTHTKANSKQNALTIFACCMAFNDCLHAQTAVHAGNAPDEQRLFWLRENLKTPKLSLMPGSRWCRVWYLWCISVNKTDMVLTITHSNNRFFFSLLVILVVWYFGCIISSGIARAFLGDGRFAQWTKSRKKMKRNYGKWKWI